MNRKRKFSKLNETCLHAPIDGAVEDVDVFKLFEIICPIKYFKLRAKERRDRIAGILLLKICL